MNQIEHELSGAPDLVFGWWGTGALEQLQWFARARPRASRVLCVDTWPNASMIVTELRERQSLRKASAVVHGLVYYSKEMRDHHISTAANLAHLPSLCIPQPLPLGAHSRPIDQLSTDLHLPHSDRPRLLFMGRSDHLFSKDIRMRKDAVGYQLRIAEGNGFDITVNSHFGVDGPWKTYPHFTPFQMIDGTFTTFISQFDLHLVTYRISNRTLRRRVSAGLSSRFAFGVAARCPLAVPRAASFAAEVFDEARVGFMYDRIEDLPDLLERQGETCRAAWDTGHTQLSAEGRVSQVNEFLQHVRSALV